MAEKFYGSETCGFVCFEFSYLIASLFKPLKILSWLSFTRGQTASGSAAKKMGMGPNRPDSGLNWSMVMSQAAWIWVAMLSASRPGFDLQ